MSSELWSTCDKIETGPGAIESRAAGVRRTIIDPRDPEPDAEEEPEDDPDEGLRRIGDEESPEIRRVTTFGVGSKPASIIRAMSSAEIDESGDWLAPAGTGAESDDRRDRRIVIRRLGRSAVPDRSRESVFASSESELTVPTPDSVERRTVSASRVALEGNPVDGDDDDPRVPVGSSPPPSRVLAVDPARAGRGSDVGSGPGPAPRPMLGATGRSSMRTLERRRAGRGLLTERRSTPRAPMAAPSRRQVGAGSCGLLGLLGLPELLGVDEERNDRAIVVEAVAVPVPELVVSFGDAERPWFEPLWVELESGVVRCAGSRDDVVDRVLEPMLVDLEEPSVPSTVARVTGAPDLMANDAASASVDAPNDPGTDDPGSNGSGSNGSGSNDSGSNDAGSGTVTPRFSIRSRNDRAASAPGPVTTSSPGSAFRRASTVLEIARRTAVDEPLRPLDTDRRAVDPPQADEDRAGDEVRGVRPVTSTFISRSPDRPPDRSAGSPT